ncbi:hypothetical protein [Bradyrhizobium guangdongense]
MAASNKANNRRFLVLFPSALEGLLIGLLTAWLLVGFGLRSSFSYDIRSEEAWLNNEVQRLESEREALVADREASRSVCYYKYDSEADHAEKDRRCHQILDPLNARISKWNADNQVFQNRQAAFKNAQKELSEAGRGCYASSGQYDAQCEEKRQLTCERACIADPAYYCASGNFCGSSSTQRDVLCHNWCGNGGGWKSF